MTGGYGFVCTPLVKRLDFFFFIYFSLVFWFGVIGNDLMIEWLYIGTGFVVAFQDRNFSFPAEKVCILCLSNL